MKVKEFAAALSASLLVILQSLTPPVVAAQVQDPNPPESFVLGEDPLVRQLGPPSELPAAARTLAADAGYRLRVVYMIPGNRTAQPEAKEVLQGFVVRMQDWFRDHMERLGYFWSDYVGLWNNVLPDERIFPQHETLRRRQFRRRSELRTKDLCVRT